MPPSTGQTDLNLEVTIVTSPAIPSPCASLPGPSRRITVEPLQTPVKAPSVPARPSPLPERKPEPKRDPIREPVPTP